MDKSRVYKTENISLCSNFLTTRLVITQEICVTQLIDTKKTNLINKCYLWRLLHLKYVSCGTPYPLCLGLTEVPGGIPEDIVHMDLSNNSISHLKANDFYGVKSLRILNISNNNMQHIDTGMCACIPIRLTQIISQIYPEAVVLLTLSSCETWKCQRRHQNKSVHNNQKK